MAVDRRFALAVAVLLLGALAPLWLEEPLTPLPPVNGRPVRVAFLGDSLTAGYGVRPPEAYPFLVGEALSARGLAVEVFAHGISGDTTTGGLARLPEVLADDPDLVLVALGVNDGARRRPVEEIHGTLTAIVERLRAAEVGVALAGMEVPPLITPPTYARDFAAMYPALADEVRAPLLPFLLEGIAWRPEWNQKDRVHPTAKGQAKIAELVTPFLEPLLREMTAAEPSP